MPLSNDSLRGSEQYIKNLSPKEQLEVSTNAPRSRKSSDSSESDSSVMTMSPETSKGSDKK